MKHPYNLLIVDDDPFIQKVLHYALRNHYEVTTRVNGLEAMKWLEEGNEPHMVITDLKMPVFSGFDLIQQIRASTFFGHIPILVLSSLEESQTRINCLEIGADDYVVKPFNPMEIKAKVDAMMRRTHGKAYQSDLLP